MIFDWNLRSRKHRTNADLIGAISPKKPFSSIMWYTVLWRHLWRYHINANIKTEYPQKPHILKFTLIPSSSFSVHYVWFGLLRIYVALAVFQPYRDLEAGDNQSLKIQVARRGIEPRTSCSASQELNHSATAAPSVHYVKLYRWMCITFQMPLVFEDTECYLFIWRCGNWVLFSVIYLYKKSFESKTFNFTYWNKKYCCKFVM